jgi:transcriptional regulator GlxA family with amidase domain
MQRLDVGILLFEDVEVLDFAGPFEVFSRTRLVPGVESRRSDDSAPFGVFTVAAEQRALRATGGLTVIPDHDFAGAPPVDVLLVPGGFGTRPLLHHAPTLDWIREAADGARWVTSVCTGALLLAAAGLLAGRRATTHWCALERLRDVDGSVHVEENCRYVDDGVLTSAGVAAGIDMAFALVEKLHGREVADETAHYIDYPRRSQ